MAEFTARTSRAAPGDGRRHDRREARPRGDRRRLRGSRRVAARSTGLASNAKRADREALRGRGRRGARRRRRRARPAALRDRLRRQVRGVRRRSSTRSPRASRPTARPRPTSSPTPIDKLAHDAQGEHLDRPVVRLEAKDGQVVDTYVHRPGGSRRERRRHRARGRRPRSSPTSSRSTSRSRSPPTSRATTSRPPSVAAERATIEEISRNEGKPEAALDEDHRGPPRTAGTRSACCSSSPTCGREADRSPSCSAPRRSSRFAQVLIGS